MYLIVFKILKYVIIQFIFIYKKIINIRINDKNKKIINIRNVYELTYEMNIKYNK